MPVSAPGCSRKVLIMDVIWADGVPPGDGPARVRYSPVTRRGLPGLGLLRALRALRGRVHGWARS